MGAFSLLMVIPASGDVGIVWLLCFLAQNILSLLLQLLSPMLVPKFGNRVTEVNFDSSFVNQDTIHP